MTLFWRSFVRDCRYIFLVALACNLVVFLYLGMHATAPGWVAVSAWWASLIAAFLVGSKYAITDRERCPSMSPTNGYRCSQDVRHRHEHRAIATGNEAIRGVPNTWWEES